MLKTDWAENDANGIMETYLARQNGKIGKTSKGAGEMVKMLKPAGVGG